MNKIIFLGLDSSALNYLYSARPEIKEEIGEAVALVGECAITTFNPMQLSCIIKDALNEETKNLFVVVDDRSVDLLYRQSPHVLDGSLSIKHYLDHYWLKVDTCLHLITFSTEHNVLHRTTWTRTGKNLSTTQLRKSA